MKGGCIIKLIQVLKKNNDNKKPREILTEWELKLTIRKSLKLARVPNLDASGTASNK